MGATTPSAPPCYVRPCLPTMRCCLVVWQTNSSHCSSNYSLYFVTTAVLALLTFFTWLSLMLLLSNSSPSPPVRPWRWPSLRSWWWKPWSHGSRRAHSHWSWGTPWTMARHWTTHHGSMWSMGMRPMRSHHHGTWCPWHRPPWGHSWTMWSMRTEGWERWAVMSEVRSWSSSAMLYNQ